MKTIPETKLGLKPVRYIAITDCTAKSCKRLKRLLKQSSYYCLVDCYKKAAELQDTELFYSPDCIIVEIRSLLSLFSMGKRLEDLKESRPGIKLILYYNMLCRYPLLEQRYHEYSRFNGYDAEEKQLAFLESLLHEQDI